MLQYPFIPILQNISPGEIQHCENAQTFSKTLVKNWLSEYKFKYWLNHKTTGKEVTKEEKEARADEIATKLCKHSDWLTHARSIKVKDFENMRLLVTDFSQNPPLDEAIMRYYTLLRMTFEITNIYKLFETPISQIYRFTLGGGPQIPNPPIIPHTKSDIAIIDFECPNCKNHSKIQANIEKHSPIQHGHFPYPIKDNTFTCPHCKLTSNILAHSCPVFEKKNKKSH